MSGTAGCATVTVEHGLKHLAAARGEKSKQQNAEGLKLEQLTGNSVDCATIQHGSRAGLVNKVEMIGALELEINVLLLPEMSRAEQAWQVRKKEQFQLSCPGSCTADARLLHQAMQHCCYIGRGGPGLLLDSAYIWPAASLNLNAAQLACRNPSCY
jgi:hypothetical protein